MKEKMDIGLHEGAFHDKLARIKYGKLSKDRVININRN
jgi:hypothetical protein